ncbi:alpha amylase, catalytic domain protein [Mycobacterium xenopi 4042]|uniref:Alpha amylase, catalytic domain protein n=1 Tax=Mycobacterium xenopi 4042 TaxID=1299334 RepID=X8CJZ7_MYCXE|nr:alpha amylase, catalytic domain protein [Mycobacterium xenopi 4042]
MNLTRDLENTVDHDPAEGSHVQAGVVEHPSADDFADAVALPADRTWYKHAVFYEVLVRAFYDANADGCGDLRGLIERLDYLQWLGIDCIWLPPFYDSPLRDGGYDIRDFYKVLPNSARSTTSSRCSMPLTAAASGSSPIW